MGWGECQGWEMNGIWRMTRMGNNGGERQEWEVNGIRENVKHWKCMGWGRMSRMGNEWDWENVKNGK